MDCDKAHASILEQSRFERCLVVWHITSLRPSTVGTGITSRMLSRWPSNIMHRRSMPMPMPPAGGMPCSSATRKSSSSFCCSPLRPDVPAWCAARWDRSALPCSRVQTISWPLMQHSKTSTVVGSSGESLASGTSSLGRCVTNVGLDERRLDQFFKHRAGDFHKSTYSYRFPHQILSMLAALGRRNAPETNL